MTMQEQYAWYAAYDESNGLHECDAKNFADVDQSQVTALFLIPLAVGAYFHRVDIPQGAQPIFFRRRSIEINPLAGEGVPRPTVNCIGWRQGDAAVYLFVFDDGSTLLSNDLQAV